MLNERRNAVAAVKDAFLPAEAAQDRAAAAAARCLATALEARAGAHLPIGTGRNAIRLLAQGTQLAIEARETMIEAHRELAGIPGEIGLATVGWGETGDCPPVKAGDEAPSRLRAVA